MADAYEICRHIRRYREKNGYAPRRSELGCDDAFVEQLIENSVIHVLPLYEGGAAAGVVLTEKGYRMATAPRRRPRAC